MAGSAFVKIFLDNGELKAGIQQSQSKIASFVSAMNKWSGEVALTSVVLTLPFKKALDTFADFDLKMRQVRAITGASSSALGELSEQARKLGRSTSFTTSEVANAMVVLGRIGFTSQEVGKSIKSVMNLAKATGSELSTAVNVAGNQLRIFGKGVDDISHVADVVTYTVNRSAMSLDEFQEAAAKAGPNFANSNSSIEQMAGSLAVLANMGIKSSIAGTALSRAIKRLADPGVEKMLRAYGVRTREFNDDLRPLHRILADTAIVMSRLPSAERIRMAEEMFGARGSMAGLPLTMNAKAIEDFMSGFDDIAGIAEETATAMDTGMFGALKRLASALNDVYISIGQLTSTTLVGWIENLSKAINRFSTSDGFLIYFSRTFTLVTTLVGSFGLAVKAISMFLVALKAMYNPVLKLDAIATLVAKKQAEEIKEKEKSELRQIASDRRIEASAKARTALELEESAKRSAAAAAEAKRKEAENLSQIAANNDIITKAQGTSKVAAAASAPGLSALAESVQSARGEVSSLESANKALRERLATARLAKDKEQIDSIKAQIAANKVLIEQGKEKVKAAVAAQKAGKAEAEEQIHSQDELIASTRAHNAELKRQSKLLHQQASAAERVARADAAKAETAKKDADKAENIAKIAEAKRALAEVETPEMRRNARMIPILMKRGGANLFLAATTKRHAEAVMNLSIADVAAAAKSAGASSMRTAGYVAEAIAAKVVAGATLLFKAALDAIAAHPVTAMIVALAATFSILKRNIDKAVKTANGHIAQMDTEAENNRKASEALKARMKEEQKGIKYLIELEKQGYATYEQQAAATKIIDNLNAKYGDLGITISHLTGHLEGAANAQNKLNEAQRAEAMQQNLKEQKTAQKSANAIGESLVATGRQKTSFWRQAYNHTGGVGEKNAELLRLLGYGYVTGKPGTGIKMLKMMGLGGNVVGSVLQGGEWGNDKIGRLSEMSPTELMSYREQVANAAFTVQGWGDEYSTQYELVKKLLDEIDELIEKRKEFNGLMDEGLKTDEEKGALPEVKEAPTQADAERAMQSLQRIADANRKAEQNSLSQTLDGIREQRAEYEKMSTTAYKFYENELKLAEAGKKEAEKPVAADLAGSLGVYGRGNIDLYDRPVLKNEDGSISTVESMSFLENGLEVLIPKIARGLNGEAVRLSEEEAIKRYRQTGEYLGKFRNASQANSYAESLHRQQEAYYGNRNNDYMIAMVAGQRAQSKMVRINYAQSVQEKSFRDQEVRARQEDYFSRGEKTMQRQKDMDNFGGAMVTLTRLIYDNSAAWRNATAEYNRTMAEAAQAGVFNGTAKETVRKSYNDRLQGLAALMEQQRDRDIELRKEYNSSLQTKSVGSFAASALNRVLGGNNVQERIADATRRTAEYLSRIATLNRNTLAQQKELNDNLGVV